MLNLRLHSHSHTAHTAGHSAAHSAVFVFFRHVGNHRFGGEFEVKKVIDKIRVLLKNQIDFSRLLFAASISSENYSCSIHHKQTVKSVNGILTGFLKFPN
jgi:hypothetical protein